MTNKEEVLHFIDRFTDNGARSEVIDCFSNGCCYWFAKILKERFPMDWEPISTPPTVIVYDPIINHFACCINGRIYDITGDITHNTQYHWEIWKDYLLKDDLETERLYRDCINF